MPSQLTAARLGAAALAPGVLVALAAIAGVRQGLIPYSLGYQMMIGATLLGLAALAAALVWALSAFRSNQSAGRPWGLPALVGALLLLYPPLSTFRDRLDAPAFFDVATDTEDAPAFKALLAARGPGDNPPAFDGLREISYKGEMRSIDYVLHKEYPQITRPHAGFLPGARHPVSVRFWRAFEAAKAMGWHIVAYSEAQGRIEATTASFWFGRISDIAIRVSPAGLGVRTDIRIQSRQDQRDDGAGARAVLQFFRELPN